MPTKYQLCAGGITLTNLSHKSGTDILLLHVCKLRPSEGTPCMGHLPALVQWISMEHLWALASLI